MSELNSLSQRVNVRRQLLASVSALTLVTLTSTMAMAEDDNHPTVWIEVGAQLERLTDGQDRFSPPFVSTLLENPFTSPDKVQTPPRYSFGQEAKISLYPSGSQWLFSASVRYGRSNSSGNSSEQTSPANPQYIRSIPALNRHRVFSVDALAKRFATTASQDHAEELVVDFQAGKDVGLGTFGSHGASTITGGLRFAQFTSRSKAKIDSDPNFSIHYHIYTHIGNYSAYIKAPYQLWDLYDAKMTATHSFHGIGPSLSWNSNATLVGSPDSGELTVDWGLSGAVLFGRQKTLVHHETAAHHGSNAHISGALPTLYPAKNHDTARSNSVLVPNIGGFAGLSFRFPSAKVSLGYRVDAFFGAMDGGIDARKIYDRNFYGPFATISVGLGG